ncbi:MAG: hypothetical protein AAFU85_31780 [Planctomycetota bacterium]
MKQFAPAFSFIFMAAFAAQCHGEVPDSGSSILGKSILAPLELESAPVTNLEPVTRPKITNHLDEAPPPVASSHKSIGPSPSKGTPQAVGHRPRPSPARKGLLQRLEAQWRKRSWLRKARQ